MSEVKATEKHKPVIAKKSSKNRAKFNDVTHLYLNDKYLKSIKLAGKCDTLLVLYLHNNEITVIENLENAINLRHLYLQKNKIKRIENIGHLRQLRRLFLGHNEISVVEGLENLENLEELHVEKQTLPEGVEMCFDPRSVNTISKSLQILNISHNKISSISSLTQLRFLRSLNAAYNRLDDIDDICDTLKNMFYLTEATFTGNPVAKRHKYRERIIGSTYHLASLDGKEITEETRIFVKHLEKEKIARRSRQSINNYNDMPDILRNYPAALQKAASESILKKSRSKESETFDEKSAARISWNFLPQRSAKVAKDQKKRNEKSAVFVNNFSYVYPQ